MIRPLLVACAAASFALAGAAADQASAATFDFTYVVGSATCSTSGGEQLCFESEALPADTYGVAGDVDEVDVTVADGEALVVPGSGSQNFLFVQLRDADAGVCPGCAVNDSSVSSITPTGYTPLGSPTAPAIPLGEPPLGPLTDFSHDAYTAVLGFTSGVPYGIPNGGFSLTGADALLKLQDSDPVALDYIVVGTLVGVPEPATWSMMLIGFFGLGAVLRGSRRRRVAAGLNA